MGSGCHQTLLPHEDGSCVQPPYAENRTYGGVGGCRGAIPGTRPDEDRVDYVGEYRVALPDNTQRGVGARGGAYPDTQGKPVRMMGATIDITERHRAEAAARELGGRLINAQEDERRRMARDRSEELSQRLALISVELD